MPRFKAVHRGLKLLPVDFDKQVQPGSFEYALCYLVDHELDLSSFHARYRSKPDLLHDKRPKREALDLFTPDDFDYDPRSDECHCPAGKRLYSNGRHCTVGGYRARKFRGAKRDCLPCNWRKRCLRTPERD